MLCATQNLPNHTQYLSTKACKNTMCSHSSSIIFTSGHATYNYLLLYSQTRGTWLFEGNRWVRIFGGRRGISLLDVKGVSSLPTCQSKSQMKNIPGSWKSPAKAPIPCSVPLAGAWSNHSPVRTVGVRGFL